MSKFKIGDLVEADPLSEYNKDDPISNYLSDETQWTVTSISLQTEEYVELNNQPMWWSGSRFRIVPAPAGGLKFDGGKLLFRPLTRGLAYPMRLVAAVLSYGAQKYAEDSWQEVPDGARRYENALDRHLNEWKAGEDFDKESGLLHLGHIACNALFLCWFEMKKQDFAQDYFKFNQPPTR